MRQQMPFIEKWPAFGITGEIAEKLKTISPATIDRYLKKDKESLRLKGKSLTKPLDSLKSRIPIRTFYSSEERKNQVSGKLTRFITADRPHQATISIPSRLKSFFTTRQSCSTLLLKLSCASGNGSLKRIGKRPRSGFSFGNIF